MLVGATTAAAACDRADTAAPTSLMDGSRPAVLPVTLEGVEEATVLTSVTVTRLEKIEDASAVRACVDRAVDDRPDGPIVVRVGVGGESVTFRNGLQTGLYGCDNSEGPREAAQRWCGGAFGQLTGGRLRDPRLDIGACTTRDDGPLGFAWIEPGRDTRYVVVRRPGYAEVYERAGGLPVRVTTGDVQIQRSSASFDVSEHTADGKLIREYRIEASVAG